MLTALLFCFAEASCPYQASHTNFINLSSSSSGGAIFIDDSTCVISLSYLLFSGTSAQSYGGGIYAFAYSLTEKDICFIGCFAYRSFAQYSNSTINSMSSACISQCHNMSNSQGYNIMFQGTSISDKYTNVSFCYASSVVSIAQMVGTTVQASFNHYCNNSDEGGASFDIQTGNSSFSISNCNVIGNSPGSSQGLIWSNTAYPIIFSECSFFGNGAAALIVLASTSSSPSTFDSCLFDIASSGLSYMTTSNCQFGLGAAVTNSLKVLSYNLCANIKETQVFTTTAPNFLYLKILPFLFIISEKFI